MKKNLTPRDIRNAVILTVVITAVVMLALLDPSCRPDPDGAKPLHAVSP